MNDNCHNNLVGVKFSIVLSIVALSAGVLKIIKKFSHGKRKKII